MQRLFVITAVILVGCGAARAQNSPNGSVMNPAVGITSPLGVPGSNGSGGTGIPLGATEIDPGGLSQSVTANCDAGGSYMGTSGTGASGMTGAVSTFDGGGLAGVGSALSPCSPGATEIGSAGISPMISSQATPCTGALSATAPGPATGAMSVGVGSGPEC